MQVDAHWPRVWEHILGHSFCAGLYVKDIKGDTVNIDM